MHRVETLEELRTLAIESSNPLAYVRTKNRYYKFLARSGASTGELAVTTSRGGASRWVAFQLAV